MGHRQGSPAAAGAITAGSVLFVVFLILKLTHVIDWSWWWITAPLWIGTAFVLVVLFIVMVVGVIVTVLMGSGDE
jgi:hypothetical protein